MVILYSTGCSRCKILKMKLIQKGIAFSEITDENEIVSAGVAEIPSMMVDGAMLGFMDAVNWVNAQ